MPDWYQNLANRYATNGRFGTGMANPQYGRATGGGPDEWPTMSPPPSGGPVGADAWQRHWDDQAGQYYWTHYGQRPGADAGTGWYNATPPPNIASRYDPRVAGGGGSTGSGPTNTFRDVSRRPGVSLNTNPNAGRQGSRDDLWFLEGLNLSPEAPAGSYTAPEFAAMPDLAYQAPDASALPTNDFDLSQFISTFLPQFQERMGTEMASSARRLGAAGVSPSGSDYTNALTSAERSMQNDLAATVLPFMFQAGMADQNVAATSRENEMARLHSAEMDRLGREYGGWQFGNQWGLDAAGLGLRADESGLNRWLAQQNLGDNRLQMMMGYMNNPAFRQMLQGGMWGANPTGG